jgi:chemotaxis protein histidine kinase CheA
VTENNYKQIGAAAIAYKHVVAANSPIDINLAKQLNILLENLGVPNSNILIDPTTGAVGYGMEYCYSIMERIRQAALTQNDEKLQYPIISNIAEEVWKVKEAKMATEEAPEIGDAAIRGVNLEAVTAVSVLQAGADLLILRSPKTLEHVRKYLSGLMTPTDLDSLEIDFSLAPEAAAEAPAPKKPAQPAKKPEPPKPAPKPEPKAAPAAQGPKEEAKPEAPKPAPKAAPAVEDKKPAAEPATGKEEYVEVDLSEEELAALRELIEVFKHFKGLLNGLAELGRQRMK